MTLHVFLKCLEELVWTIAPSLWYVFISGLPYWHFIFSVVFFFSPNFSSYIYFCFIYSICFLLIGGGLQDGWEIKWWMGSIPSGRWCFGCCYVGNNHSGFMASLLRTYSSLTRGTKVPSVWITMVLQLKDRLLPPCMELTFDWKRNLQRSFHEHFLELGMWFWACFWGFSSPRWLLLAALLFVFFFFSVSPYELPNETFQVIILQNRMELFFWLWNQCFGCPLMKGHNTIKWTKTSYYLAKSHHPRLFNSGNLLRS